ncbi:MAG: D-glycero-beta-D-manno-heptose 1-phosphate adenylyltransferase [Desulfovibrio sp.]|nr:D-glycero-beta-D-manno-heptose 1-phosphate adenylyltransferase [Desulfovibrio sp.]
MAKEKTVDLALSKRLLVLGDVMLDRYTETQVRRISPEAPVPVANVLRRWNAPGGAANVARNLSRLGLAVTLVGARANDRAGQELSALLDQESIIAPPALFTDRPTTCKSRILARGQQLLRLDEESCEPLAEDLLNKLWQNTEHALPWAQAVILSDYGKGVLNECAGKPSLARQTIARCQEQKIPVLVDPKGSDWSRFACADCLTPNTQELVCVLKRADDDFALLAREAMQLMQALTLKRLLVTRGAKGMAMLEAGGQVTELPTKAREVCDVSGAGDTVIAVLAAAVADGCDWIKAAKIANLAAGIVVAKVGTSPVDRDELLSALASDNNSFSIAVNALSAKIMSQGRLLEKLAEWRRHHDRIVFTNGCFDLIHPGHIKLVQEAAHLGDRLVVAINSDASVKRLKGPDRPIQAENARALVMAGMNGVDAVVLFDDDTPLELITKIQPDVLVKGSDYRLDTVIGADIVQKSGGEVHLVQIIDGFSTSNIVSSFTQ